MRIRSFAILVALLMAALSPRFAFAQCSGFGGVPFNCALGSTPQAGDYILGGSVAGSNTVKWTWSQALSASAPAVAALFASPPAIGGTTPNSAAFTTELIGTGALSGNPYQLQSAISTDPSTGVGSLAGIYRMTMFNTTLSYGATTTNIWEGATFFTTVNGPGTATGEINMAHTYLQVNSGATVVQSEDYESSALNDGAITTFDGNLAIFHNGSSGTITSYNGINFALTNDNTTAGAVNAWQPINCNAMIGAGSQPSFSYCIRESDPLTHSAFQGHLASWSVAGNLPTLSGCGGGSPSLDSKATDTMGTITEGTTASGCTLTFKNVYNTGGNNAAPHCVISSPNGATLTSYTVSNSAIVIVNPSATGNEYTYECLGSL